VNAGFAFGDVTHRLHHPHPQGRTPVTSPLPPNPTRIKVIPNGCWLLPAPSHYCPGRIRIARIIRYCLHAHVRSVGVEADHNGAEPGCAVAALVLTTGHQWRYPRGPPLPCARADSYYVRTIDYKSRPYCRKAPSVTVKQLGYQWGCEWLGWTQLTTWCS
jgi:hypothetical protein